MAWPTLYLETRPKVKSQKCILKIDQKSKWSAAKAERATERAAERNALRTFDF